MPPTMPPSTHDQQRLDERGQGVDGGLDLLVVEVGDLVEHLVERAGLLADRHHLHDHRREHRMLLERAGERLARLTPSCVVATADGDDLLPAVSATMSSASRIGTPERTSADSVREKRASAVLRTSAPKTGDPQLERVPRLAGPARVVIHFRNPIDARRSPTMTKIGNNVLQQVETRDEDRGSAAAASRRGLL